MYWESLYLMLGKSSSLQEWWGIGTRFEKFYFGFQVYRWYIGMRMPMNVLMIRCPFSTLRFLSKVYFQLKPIQFWMEKKDWRQFYALQILGYSATHYIQIFCTVCTYPVSIYFLSWVLYWHDQDIIGVKRYIYIFVYHKYTGYFLMDLKDFFNYLKIFSERNFPENQII